MSWSMEFAGKRDEVKAKVQAASTYGDPVQVAQLERVKTFVGEELDAMPEGCSVYVKGHGHADGNGANGSPRSATLEVRQMYEPPPRAA